MLSGGRGVAINKPPQSSGRAKGNRALLRSRGAENGIFTSERPLAATGDLP